MKWLFLLEQANLSTLSLLRKHSKSTLMLRVPQLLDKPL